MATHTQLKKFGLRIQALRKVQKLSQEELAVRSGLHRTYIGGIERGERNVAFLNILKIAHALNVTPAELFQGIDSE
jgi:transcriptional regulator with XRE-family HTH domain